MKAKLIKGKHSGEYLLNMEGVGYITTYESSLPYKLSLKNCQSIERGYDLDELFQREIDELMFTGNLEDPSEYRSGMYKGVKIFLELMGDKKFSEYDMKSIFEYGWNQRHYEIMDETELEEIKNRYIQSLQQTEWDVEIEMEEKWIAGTSTYGHGEYELKPKLDADGCLILKRI